MKLVRNRLASLALLLAVGAAACSDGGGGTTPNLSAPTGVEVRALAPTRVLVQWEAVSGATTYEVERAEGAGGGSYASVGTSSTNSFEDTGVTVGNQYRYRVVASTGSVRSPASNPSSAFTVPNEIFAVLTQDITSNRRFHRDTTYVLSGFIKVANGATLTIDPGTRIVGDYDIPGSSLFILRGSRIVAEGTREAPIVFTSERPVGQRQPGDWGGVILIGNGIINRDGETGIEGTGTPADINPRQFYHGGTDNDDSSGVLKYVRIEFAGYPTAPNEELNSLTMAAVGAGTRIEYVQTLLGLDDSFEWFGGAVNGKYLISYESGDDHFDASEGYIGRNQYMIAFQSFRPIERPGLAGGVAPDPQGIENDGCWANNCIGGQNNTNAQPYTIPVFANFTLVGAGSEWENPGGNYGMMLRRGTGGLYVNGVVTRYARAAVSLRGQNTWARHEEGNLRLRNLYVSGTNGVFQAEDLTNANLENRQFVPDLAEHALEAGDVTVAGLFAGVPADRTAALAATAATFDWTPAAGSPIASGGLTSFASLPQRLIAATEANQHPNSTIEPTAFRGAADPDGPKWWEGWTYYARN